MARWVTVDQAPPSWAPHRMVESIFGFGSLGVGRNADLLSDLNKPAMVFVILEEHADSIDDGVFIFKPGGGITQPHGEQWRELPASYHHGACCRAFADGHAVVHPWLKRSGLNKTIYPVTMTAGRPWTTINLVVSRDYEWLDDHMPYKD